MDEREIFERALDLDPAERSAYLAQACGDDDALRARIEALLHSHEQAGSFLQGAAAAPSVTVGPPVTEKPGTQIGRYKLLEVIGEGGFGVVFMAEQQEPVRRKVALKIIKPGMDTKEVIARFEAERQALAIMDHPNIAKVLDAGATESGRPYFVMELVRGVPITDFCDQNSLSARERLGLFASVCQAVQHAHQKGIIHRDIKPSNVLVTMHDDRAVAKVIDFGVAKATNARLTEKTLFTRFAQMVGTPLYMSPEQAQMSGLDVDTRSDVYSLGVLLYELLTGTTPFDQQRIREAAYDELLRIIREEEPPRPSLRISTLGDTLPSVAAHRKVEPKKLSALVRGELDWIVMKALEKDRARRYETASAFAADIEHYLKDEPVAACPPSRSYRFKKFARRNKTALATTAAVALALLAGTSVATWQAYRARSASQRAEQEAGAAKTQAAIAAAVSDFLQDDLLGMAGAGAQVKAEIPPDPNLELRTVLDRAASKIPGRFAEQPLVEAAIRNTIGNAYHSIGLYDEAEKHLKRAVELRQRTHGPEHADTLRSMHVLAIVYLAQGRYRKAEELNLQVLEVRRRTLGEEHVETLKTSNNLANCYLAQGRNGEAEDLHKKTLEIRRRTLGEEHAYTLSSIDNLARVYRFQSRYEEAERLHRQTLEIRRRTLGAEHPKALSSIGHLADVYLLQGRYAEAQELYRDALETERRVLGPEHPLTLSTMGNLAVTFSEQGRRDEARDLLQQVLDVKRRVDGPEHPHTLLSVNDLANLLSRSGKYGEAEKLYRETLQIQRRVLGPEHPEALMSMYNLAISIGNQGRYAEAEKLHRETLEARRRVLGPEHADTLDNMQQLASTLKYLGKQAEAIALHREALAIQQRALGREHPSTLVGLLKLASTLLGDGQNAEAETLCRRFLQVAEGKLGPEHPYTLNGKLNLAIALGEQGEYSEAEAVKREVLEIRQRTLSPEHPEVLMSMFQLARTLGSQGKSAEAESLLREFVEVKRRTAGAEHPLTLLGMNNLALELRAQGELAEAESLQRELLKTQTQVLGPEHPDTLQMRLNLGSTLQLQGSSEEANEIYRGVIQAAPARWDAHLVLGSSLAAGGQKEQAVDEYLQAIELGAADDAALERAVVSVYETMGAAAVIDVLSKAIENGTDTPRALFHRGDAHAALGQASLAATDLQGAIQAGSSDHRAWWALALIQLYRGNSEEYRTTCRDMFARFSDAPNAPGVRALTAWTCGLQPGALEDESAAIALAEQAAPHSPLGMRAHALWLCRAERFEEAAALLADEKCEQDDGRCAAFCLRALACHRAGREDEAREWFEKAGRLNHPVDQVPWHHRLTFELLHAEAEQTLNADRQHVGTEETTTGR